MGKSIGGVDLSGRTTCLEHRQAGDNWKYIQERGDECIQHPTVLEVQWSNCPVEVEAAVREMWASYEYQNDHVYHAWQMDDVEPDPYEYDLTTLEELMEYEPNEVPDKFRWPLIQSFLESKGLKGRVLIHWWW